MTIFNLFSTRQKKLRGEMPDVYQYEEIPDKLRVQIIYIIWGMIGKNVRPHTREYNVYKDMHEILCREYGLFTLTNQRDSNEEAIFNYFLKSNDYERCLDIVELFFKLINVELRRNPSDYNSEQTVDEAIDELNERFKEAGVGYQFEQEANEIIRVDSQFIHSEVVKPVLKLLNSKRHYSGANDEFLSAHEHYRHKRYKECLSDCLKSFESIMRAIHTKHSWECRKNATARELIQSCFDNNLVPNYLSSQFTSLRSLLESGVPTIRNRESGHGQGEEIKEVPEHLARYALHLTATNLLFLMECEQNL